MASVSSPDLAPQRSVTERVLLGLVLGGTLWYLGALLWVAWTRQTYPFDLEWMEGGVLTHAVRLQRGQPLYAAPSLDFVAFFYTPLYPVVLTWLCPWFPLGYTLGRCVSLLATLGTLWLLYVFGKREAGRLAGLLAMGFYAALFRVTGTFHDLVRPDALAVFLILAGAFTAHVARGWLGICGAALVFVAAYYTKQTAAVMGLAVGLWLFTRSRRRGAVFLLVGLGVGLAIGLVYDAKTAGWFRFYVVEGHQQHRFLWRNALLEYWRDLLFLMPLFCIAPWLRESYPKRRQPVIWAFGLLWALAVVQRIATLDYPAHLYYQELWYERVRWALLVPPVLVASLLGFARLCARPREPVPSFFLFFLGGGVLGSLLNHGTQWAYSNCFLPVALASSLYLARAVQGYLTPCLGAQGPARVAVLLALCVQLVALAYSPRAQVPNTEDRAALRHLGEVISSFQSKVLMPAHPYFAYALGSPVVTHQIGISDVGFAGPIPDLEPRLRNHEFPVVVLDAGAKLPGLERNYHRVGAIRYATPTALLPRTGFLTRPVAIYRPR